eukprot:842529-Prymnesium_polylepis.1
MRWTLNPRRAASAAGWGGGLGTAGALRRRGGGGRARAAPRRRRPSHRAGRRPAAPLTGLPRTSTSDTASQRTGCAGPAPPTRAGGSGKADADSPTAAARSSFIRAPTMSAWQKTAERPAGPSAAAAAHAARISSAVVPYGAHSDDPTLVTRLSTATERGIASWSGVSAWSSGSGLPRIA